MVYSQQMEPGTDFVWSCVEAFTLYLNLDEAGTYCLLSFWYLFLVPLSVNKPLQQIDCLCYQTS